MGWLDIGALGALTMGFWIFFSIAVLPRLVTNTGAVLILTLVGGVIIFWTFEIFEPRSPLYIVASNLVLFVGALLAGFHSEIIFRRRTGRWRFLDPDSANK